MKVVEISLTPEQVAAVQPIYDAMMALFDAVGPHVVTVGQLIEARNGDGRFATAKFIVVVGDTADRLVNTTQRYVAAQHTTRRETCP